MYIGPDTKLKLKNSHLKYQTGVLCNFLKNLQKKLEFSTINTVHL